VNHTCRKEQDFLGEKKIESCAYWGIHTQRALENFSLSSLKVPPHLIRAMAMIKKAACQTNVDLGYLDEAKASAIISACDEIISGRFADQFALDALQGGAGTSTHMNVNEVIANRALELSGYGRADYGRIHPIDDVNKHQSTNDVYPTAVKIALIFLLRELGPVIEALQGRFQEKEKEFSGIVKIGRTQLQEAVPIVLGAEFSSFAEAVSRDRWRVFKCEERLRVVNIGGTAVGTGLGAPQRYIFLVIEKLRSLTGLGLARAENLMGETAHADVFVEVSGILKAHAISVMKIADDLRLMNLLGEIRLPHRQVGSSIMPGKVNPVILESVIQAGMKVIANDGIVADAASRGRFQINEFLPLLSFAMIESLEILIGAGRMTADYISGITADAARCREVVDSAQGMMTALIPVIGYKKAEALLKQFESVKDETENLRKFLEEQVGSDIVAQALSVQRLTSLGYRDEG